MATHRFADGDPPRPRTGGATLARTRWSGPGRPRWLAPAVALAGWCAFTWYLVAQALGGPAIIWSDSTAYRAVASKPLLSVAFWAGPRPPLSPLLIKIVGSSAGYPVAQAVIGALAWGALAWTVGRLVAPGWQRVVAVWVILAFASSLPDHPVEPLGPLRIAGHEHAGVGLCHRHLDGPVDHLATHRGNHGGLPVLCRHPRRSGVDRGIRQRGSRDLRRQPDPSIPWTRPTSRRPGRLPLLGGRADRVGNLVFAPDHPGRRGRADRPYLSLSGPGGLVRRARDARTEPDRSVGQDDNRATWFGQGGRHPGTGSGVQAAAAVDGGQGSRRLPALAPDPSRVRDHRAPATATNAPSTTPTAISPSMRRARTGCRHR